MRKQFQLIAIDKFDARYGYMRCVPPGVGVSFEGNALRGAKADLWRDRSGELVVRFSSGSYSYHFAARLASGKQVPESDMSKFGEFVADALSAWICEGVDDVPEPRM